MSSCKSVTGIDISKQSVKYARSIFPSIEFQSSSIERAAHVGGDIYNLVSANMVLQNLTHLKTNISSIVRLLKSGGIFIFSIPHPCFWFQKKSFADDFEFAYDKEITYKIPFKIRNGNVHESLITYVHRPLHMYYSAMVSHSLEVLEMLEVGEHSSDSNPDIIFCVCRKKHV